jgi:tRNA(Ile)-lysidine synthase
VKTRHKFGGRSAAETLATFPAQQRYLIGVSGGRDSVALLHWLVGLGYGRLIVCHLDHRLRGRSSAADARFVERLAVQHGLGFETAAADVRMRAADEKLSIETAARAARYDFFARVARRRRCRTIFLGHHADDLVESFLINLFRGAGTTGQRGMQSITTRTIQQVQLTIVRPLLGVWRSEIESYVRENRLKYREDATNERLDALRNRVRHRVIPDLQKQFGRDIRKSVHRAATIAAEEHPLLEGLLPPFTSRPAVQQLRNLPVALQRRALVQWLRSSSIADVGFDMAEAVRSLLAPGGPAKVNLTGGRHARRRAGELFIE